MIPRILNPIFFAAAALVLMAEARGQDAPAPSADARSTAVTGIAGRWEGTLNIQGLSLRVVFRVTETEDGTTALFDSPDQLAIGIPERSRRRSRRWR